MSQNANQPKRFSIVEHEWLGDILEEKPDGEYVRHSDYAALAAENERIAVELEQRCRELNLSLGQQAVQLGKIGELAAENERLRKAGDAMAYELHSCEPDRQIALVEDWFAAKEGSDAK